MVKVYFYEHIASEIYKEYDVEVKTFGDIVEELKLEGYFSIVDGDRVLYYPDCAKETPHFDIIHIKRVPENGGALNAVLGAVTLGIGVFLWNPALMMAGGAMLLGSAMSLIMTPNSPNLKEQDALKERYGLTGGRNKVSLGSKYPVIFGEHRIAAPIVGTYYSTLSDDTGEGDQYLTFLLCAGYKDLQLTDFKIGLNDFAANNDLIMNGFVPLTGTYSGALEIRQDGSYPNLYPYKVYEEQLNSEIQYFSDPSEFSETRITVKNTISIAAFILFQGLFRLNKEGKKMFGHVEVIMKWRPKSGGAWSEGIYRKFSYKKNAVLRFTMEHIFTEEERLANPSGEWEVILYRTNEASAATTTVDKVYLSALQSRTTIRPVIQKELDKMCVVAVKVIANAATQGILDQLSCVAKSVLPIWDGEDWNAKAPTSNPASHYLAALQGQYLTKTVKDSRIDWEALQSLYNWCEANEYYCNGVISNGESLYQILNKILSTCRAKFYLKNGLYSLVHDDIKVNPVALLTPKNSSGFSATKKFPEKVNAINATFEDASADWTTTNEEIYLDGVGEETGDNKQDLSLWGVTSYAQAVKLCRYMLACNELRPEVYGLTVSLEHFSMPVGSRVLVQHDVLTIGIQSGYITKVDGNRITLDEIIPKLEENNYALRVFKQNGAIDLIPVQTPITATDTLTASVSFSVGEGDMYAFGILDKETQDCVIEGKVPNPNLSATLSLVPYSPEIFDAAHKPIPPYDPKVQPSFSYDLSIIGELPETDEGINIQDDGSIYLDFGEYALKENEQGNYVYNQGALADLGDGYYSNLSFTTISGDQQENWAASAGNSSLEFNVDNILWTDSSICFWLKNLILTTERQVVFHYNDIGNTNDIMFYVENNSLFLSTQNYVHEIDTSNIDLSLPNYFVIQRDFENSDILIYINGYLSEMFNFKSLVFSLISEDTSFNIISEDGDNLTSEEYAVSKVSLDREIKFYMFSDESKQNQAICSLRDVHIFGRILDEKSVESLYDTGIILTKVDILSRFLGRFLEAPTNAKIGDTFLYEGSTNENFINGGIYTLTVSGWILEEEK